MKNSLLIAQDIAYSFDTHQLFSEINLSLGREKVGLVGRNGVGKSTFIKILAGIIKPTHGVISSHVRIGYMPQDLSPYRQQTVAEFLKIETILQSMNRIANGIGTDQDHDIIDSQWPIVERAKKLCSQLMLGHIDFSRDAASLSGGEATRLFLVRLLLQDPDFLILDEPTNNLDYESREALYTLIQKFKGGVLVVSHDRTLLSFMERIGELTSDGLMIYGGNYAHYSAQKHAEMQARERHVVEAEKTFKKTKKVVQQTKERYAKRVSGGEKFRRFSTYAKILLDAKSERSEKTKSKLETQADKRLEAAREKLAHAKAQREEQEQLYFKLESTRVHATKKVLEVKNLSFAYPGGSVIMRNVNVVLMGPQRIAVKGPNGSGKTTFFKLIMQQLTPTTGTVSVGVQHYAYLDQNLSLLDFSLSVLENFKRHNPQVTEEECRAMLASFLFSHEMILQAVETLSGGEKMRAALACVLLGETPAQFIILDEPTNNLDLQSIASMENALREYKGALMVASHDDAFLHALGIEETINLVDWK